MCMRDNHTCIAPAIVTASKRLWRGHGCATHGHRQKRAHDIGVPINKKHMSAQSPSPEPLTADDKPRPRTDAFCNINVCAQSDRTAAERILRHKCICRHTRTIDGGKGSATHTHAAHQRTGASGRDTSLQHTDTAKEPVTTDSLYFNTHVCTAAVTGTVTADDCLLLPQNCDHELVPSVKHMCVRNHME